jgi:hypothetical protein
VRERIRGYEVSATIQRAHCHGNWRGVQSKTINSMRTDRTDRTDQNRSHR